MEYVNELLAAEMSVQIFFLGGHCSVHPYSMKINGCEWSTEDGKGEGNWESVPVARSRTVATISAENGAHLAQKDECVGLVGEKKGAKKAVSVI